MAARVVWVRPTKRGLVPLELGLEVIGSPPEFHSALAELFAELG
jgi:hypothetical protein